MVSDAEILNRGKKLALERLEEKIDSRCTHCSTIWKAKATMGVFNSFENCEDCHKDPALDCGSHSCHAYVSRDFQMYSLKSLATLASARHLHRARLNSSLQIATADARFAARGITVPFVSFGSRQCQVIVCIESVSLYTPEKDISGARIRSTV